MLNLAGMETIGVVGVSFRRGGADALARFTVPKDEQQERLPEMARQLGVAELVYLATCNRVEVAFKGNGETSIREYRQRVFRTLTGRDPEPGESERTFRAWAGEGAVEHLFLVAAGLDSAQLGEREIRGQLRDALKLARAAGVSGTLLDQIIGEALRVAGEVHRRVDAGRGRTSLADVAADHLRQRVKRTPGRVVLVGVSPMTRRCARFLAEDEIELLIVNRTPERAAELAEKLGIEVRPLADFRRRPDAVEALLLATGSPEPVLERADLERIAARTPSGEPPLVIDMAVPPDVDPEAARAAGVVRIGMNEITAEAEACRSRRLLELAPARELVDEALANLRKQLAERFMYPIIAKLNQRYRQTVVEGVDRLFRKDLQGLDDKHREVITRWAEVMARRFAHIPTMGLRVLASEVGAPAVRTFLEASGDDFFAEFADAADQLEGLPGQSKDKVC